MEDKKQTALRGFILAVVAASICWLVSGSFAAIFIGRQAEQLGKESEDVENHPYRTFAKIARIMGKVASIVGIVMAAFWVIYLTVMFVCVVTV